MKKLLFSSGEFYNLFYANKDYELEAQYISKKFECSEFPIKTILELGCGTGIHASYLTNLGFKVFGIEQSK